MESVVVHTEESVAAVEHLLGLEVNLMRDSEQCCSVVIVSVTGNFLLVRDILTASTKCVHVDLVAELPRQAQQRRFSLIAQRTTKCK